MAVEGESSSSSEEAEVTAADEGEEESRIRIAAAPLMERLGGKQSDNVVDELCQEYEALKTATDAPSDLSSQICLLHADANRYKDILCWDQTRVPLIEGSAGDGDEDAKSDYIHASWVDGVRADDAEFICTQGPTDSTSDDFWKMIWERRVALVLMLCQTQEGGREKCAQYFPSDVGASAAFESGIRVSVLDSEAVSEGAHRLLQSNMRLTRGSERRSLVHVLHQNWPDRTLPPSSLPLVTIIQRVSSAHAAAARSNGWDPAASPKLVHCSAGIGRTGTYIGISNGLACLRLGLPLSVPDLVRRLRRQRRHSVQTKHQYVFIYLALAEFALARCPLLTVNLDPLRKFITT